MYARTFSLGVAAVLSHGFVVEGWGGLSAPPRLLCPLRVTGRGKQGCLPTSAVGRHVTLRGSHVWGFELKRSNTITRKDEKLFLRYSSSASDFSFQKRFVRC